VGGGQRVLLALPIFLFLVSSFLKALFIRLPLSIVRFQVLAFQRCSFLPHAQVPESSSATARSWLLGYSKSASDGRLTPA
jgi:hypothetical protein